MDNLSMRGARCALAALVLAMACVLALGARAEVVAREFGRTGPVDPEMVVVDTPPPPDRRAESPDAKGAWMTATPEEVSVAIAEILKAEPRHHLIKDAMARMVLADQVVGVARYYDVPPLLVTTIMFRESTFDEKAVGKRGELGLMQVAKGNVARFACDMDTATGQIECGAHLLRMQFDKCGSWRGALTSYATTKGACTSDNEQVQNKVKLRLRDWQRLSRAVQAALYEQGDEE